MIPPPLLLLLPLAGPDDLAVLADTVVDQDALHIPGARWNTTVNGTAFQQPALTSHAGWQYTTWWDGERRLCVARRELPDGAWQVVRFDDHRFETDDTHNVSVVGVCPRDGTIHLAFDHHNSPLHYRVSRPEAANDPGAFEWTTELFGPVRDALRAGEPLRRLTYPRFVRTPGGDLQLCFRLGSSGDGHWYLADYLPGRNGWQAHELLISGGGPYGASESRCAYLNGFTYDGRGRLHLSWCWRETPDPMSNHDLHHGYSDDGGRTWYAGGEESVAKRGGRPFLVGTQGIRFARIDMYRGLANSTTQDVDSEGRVHVVTFHLPDGTPSQLGWTATRERVEYFHYRRGEDGVWHRSAMGFRGTRPQLVRGPDDDLYLVYTGDRYHPELEDLVVRRAEAEEGWEEWRVVHRVEGPFTGQPQVDRTRAPEVLSIYAQERPDPADGTRSPLRVVDLQLGGE